MTTPNDTPDDTTRRTDTITTRQTDPDTAARPATTASPQMIPGRTPLTEEAGAPLVPPITTQRPTQTRSPDSPQRSEDRTSARPPTDGAREAPLVPDLRPAPQRRTDGGSR